MHFLQIIIIYWLLETVYNKSTVTEVETMLKVYGSHFCPYTMECVRKYNAAGIQYEFHDISEGLLDLKEFLVIRDKNDEEFAEAKANGKLGVPFLVKDNGEVTHDWRSLVK